MKILINDKVYELASYDSEAELEEVVEKHSNRIFGENSIYISIKKRVKENNNSFANIPDAYLIDFRKEPKLWVIENELSRHDSFKHVGVQMLQFASQFTEGSYKIKTILNDAINNNQTLKEKIQKLVKSSRFENINHALDFAINENDFGFVIVIDKISDDLYNITNELSRRPELIELQKYHSGKDEIYLFDELLEEVNESKSQKVKEIEDIDTMIAPAKADGHKKVFLEQKAWWAVRISPSILPKLKYLAMYEVSPISAIRWVGKIQSIKPYEETGKYKIYLSEISEIKPIKLETPRNAPQGPRYTTYELLRNAKTMDDV